MLSSLKADDFTTLGAFFEAEKIVVKPIYYVRDVYGFLFSCYGQVVRNQGFTGDFRQYIESAGTHDFMSAIGAMGSLGRPPTILHYETEKTRLCESFLERVLGTDFRRDMFSGYEAIRYPSLSAAEIEILRFANQHHAAHFPGELANLFLNKVERRTGAVPYDPGIVDLVTRRWGGSVDKINQTYFPDRKALRIVSGEPAPHSERNTLDEPMRVFLEWALGKLERSRAEDISRIVMEAEHLARYSEPPPDVDMLLQFDPVAYLLKNPDLLLKRVNPYQHYLKSGLPEGRTFLFDPHPLKTVEALGSLTLYQRIRLALGLILGFRGSTARRGAGQTSSNG